MLKQKKWGTMSIMSKINREELRFILSTPEAAKYVHDRVFSLIEKEKEFANTTGIVCGGAVTAAVVEYLKIENEITPVYNDVDLFIPLFSSNLHFLSLFNGGPIPL